MDNCIINDTMHNKIDDKNKKILKQMEISGFFFVSLAAFVLHFLYEWSGNEFWTTLFSAVNESVWEHLKIFTLPYLFWAFFEICVVKIPFKKFVSAKILSLYFLLFSIPIFYYTYTGVFGKNFAVIDILSGFILTALTFAISFKMITNAPCIEKYYKLSVILLILYTIMIAFFTYTPPEIGLFKDPVSGSVGL